MAGCFICGPWALFLFQRKMVMRPDNLTDLVKVTVESLGYELVGVEYEPSGKEGSVLRLYIDQEDGITLDDCAAVSHQVSGMLDVEDPIKGTYKLEVSSPGLDRPLFSKDDFDRFAGKRVRLSLYRKKDGRRRFNGVLEGTRGDAILLDIDGERYELPLDQIEKARLVPEY